MNRSVVLLDTPEIIIGRFDHPPDRPHRDPAEEIAGEFSINRVERGRFDIHVGRQLWILEPGYLFLSYPGLIYRCRHHELFPPDVCLTVTYQLSGSDQEIDDLAQLARLACKKNVLPPTNRFAYLFRCMSSVGRITENCMAAESSATELLAELSAGVVGKGRLYREHQLAWYAERVDAARSLLHKQYAAPQNLAPLARSVGMSTFHFARVFAELAGIPPHRYLLRVRLVEAARRLLQGDSVTDACFATGFHNLSHFIRVFQRRFGTSPAKYATPPISGCGSRKKARKCKPSALGSDI